MQAFARDDVFSSIKIFARGSGPSNEPRTATILTFFIAQICILLGDLNAIAPIVTMFFMITYGTLNLSTFYESITGNPSYRPQFRMSHWSTSLLGAAGCTVAMFLISPLWATVSILAITALYWGISCKEIKARWGDVNSGIIFERIRKNLLKLEDQRYHPKNWRPIIVGLTGGAWDRLHIALYGYWLTAGHGILTLAQIIVGDTEDLLKRRNAQEKILRNFINEQELSAFPAVVITPSISEGVTALAQCHGLGGLRPNTLLTGWCDDVERMESFGTLLRTLAGLKISIIAIRIDEEWGISSGTIDVWWRGKANGPLLLLLAYLLTQNNEWRTRPIRLLRIIPSQEGQEKAYSHLRELISISRINAMPVVIVANDVGETIRRTSANSAVIFLGFTVPEKDKEQEFVTNMNRMVGDLPTVIFVDSAGGMELDV